MTQRLLLLAASLACFAGPSLAASAQEALAPAAPQLIVVGSATIERPPDHATISIGVTARGGTAAAAIDETAVAAAKVAEAARGFGIAARDIQTSYVSLQPAFRNVRAPSGGFQQQPDGYQATNSVSVRLRDLGKLGEFMRRGVTEGGNRIGDLAFGLGDRAEAEREANTAAMAHAREQAQTLAGAAGVKLGRIQEIRPVSRSGAPVRTKRSAPLRTSAVDVPVEPGSLEITAEVEVTWLIEQP